MKSFPFDGILPFTCLSSMRTQSPWEQRETVLKFEIEKNDTRVHREIWNEWCYEKNYESMENEEDNWSASLSFSRLVEHEERLAIWIRTCTGGSQRYWSDAGQSIEAFPWTVVRVPGDDVDLSICRRDYRWIASVTLAWPHWKPKSSHWSDQTLLVRSLDGSPQSTEHVRLDLGSPLSC